MAKIHGQVESLKKLKNELEFSEIDRFNSIREIRSFVRDIEIEKENIVNRQREILKSEIADLKVKIKDNKQELETIRINTTTEIEVRIDTIKYRIESLIIKTNKSLLHRFFCFLRLNRQKKLLEHYTTNTQEIIQDAIKSTQEVIFYDENKLKQLQEDSDRIINDRCEPEIEELVRIRKVIKRLNSLIAGAIGESQVVKEIAKLPDDFVLINDFKLVFNPPIYNRKTNDKIFSIQVDHILVSRSGIYILETKNWSKKSIESLDLRSPVDQITRTSYALFVLVNDASIRLDNHHWGAKKIPIRNIIVMINETPKEDFKYVKVLSIKELNRYVTYFEPIFSLKEVERISKYLIELKDY